MTCSPTAVHQPGQPPAGARTRRAPGRWRAALALAVVPVALLADAAPARVVTFDYVTQVGPVEGDAPVDIWIPLAAQTERQQVLGEHIDSAVPGRIGIEPRYGNRFWHATLPAAVVRAGVAISVRTTVARGAYRVAVPQQVASLSEQEREQLALFLGGNQKVPVGHPILDPILAEVRSAVPGDDLPALARGIYDWVVDNIEYKKVGTGWGNGDTFWACREGYGNCTDFHALFISLARTVGIPARFEIGFPIPQDRDSAQIGGYHCWVEFYLPGAGWIPVDASEAAKHPEQRDYLFGGQGADRIMFSMGRDLVLDAAQRSGPLNYFVYPHLERAGQAYRGPLATRFSFAQAPEQPALADAAGHAPR